MRREFLTVSLVITVIGFSCFIEGTEGDNCNNHCGEHGTCTMHVTHNGNVYWYCHCDHGWTGTHCTSRLIFPTTLSLTTTEKLDTSIGYNSACNYHGYLTQSGCHCHDHWTGDTCQHHTQITTQCHNVHGICTYLKDSSGHEWNHHCVCSHGWQGDRCDQMITFSQSSPAITTTIPSTTTTIPDIWIGFDKECNNHGYMKQSGCHCHENWTGDTCQYPPGSGNSDHCNNNCGEHGTCKMHISNHGTEYWTCKCDFGWHGAYCTIKYNVTLTTTQCHNTYCVHGACTYRKDSNGHEWNHHCVCSHGWQGDHCDQTITPISQSSSTPATTTISMTTATTTPDTLTGYQKECNYHGYMKPSGCHCHDHWTGDTCQYPPGTGNFDFCNNHCGEHGTCTKYNSNHGTEYWTCKCDHGWHGFNCTVTYNHVTHVTTQCHNTYCVNGLCAYRKDSNGHQWNHHCLCRHGWQGDHCDQSILQASNISSSSTTMSASTTSTPTTAAVITMPTSKKTTLTSPTTIVTTTPTTPPTATKQTTLKSAAATSAVSKISTTNTPQTSTANIGACNHVDTLSALAQQTSVSNQNAYECSPGLHTSHEALVLTECLISQSPSFWKQGIHVMTGCSSTNAIPNYTPIAAFDNGQYSSRGSLSGIFLGCTSDGFKMAVQFCGQTPFIAQLHIGGVNTQNPNSYYTVS